MSINQLLFEVVYKFQITSEELKNLDYFNGSGNVYDKLEQSYKYFSLHYLGKEQLLFMQFIKQLEKFLNSFNKKNFSQSRSKSDQRSQNSYVYYKFIIVDSKNQQFLTFLNEYNVYDFFLIQAQNQKTAIEYFENYVKNQLHIKQAEFQFKANQTNIKNQVQFMFCHFQKLEIFKQISDKFEIFHCEKFQYKNDNKHMILNVMFQSICNYINQHRNDQDVEEMVYYKKRQISLSNPSEIKHLSSQLLNEKERQQLQHNSRLIKNRLSQFSKDLDQILQKYSLEKDQFIIKNELQKLNFIFDFLLIQILIYLKILNF